jgi:hypothetical protein
LKKACGRNLKVDIAFLLMLLYLLSLEQASAPGEIDGIFSELWNELHHLGDVGLASYFAVHLPSNI